MVDALHVEWRCIRLVVLARNYRSIGRTVIDYVVFLQAFLPLTSDGTGRVQFQDLGGGETDVGEGIAMELAMHLTCQSEPADVPRTIGTKYMLWLTLLC